MVNEEKKFTYGIKGKLVSAIAMLLVATIMVVSSSYAWFTLSTAPEVTGISTAVGANGNLEMLLLTVGEDGEFVYNDGVIEGGVNAAQTVKNTYWGNLVNLADGYGLDQIVLYPSVLAEAGTPGADGRPTEISGGAILKTPVYGADGRISKLEANAVAGVYENSAFYQNEDKFGVRAVGTSSGMTARQLAYRNALSAAATAMSQAKNAAASSLSANGSALADIAIKRGLNADAKYTQAEREQLLAIATALRDNVLPKIETAYMQYILALSASQAVTDALVGSDDFADEATAKEAAELVYQTVQSAISASGATASSVLKSLTDNGYTPNAILSDYIGKLNITKADVTDAITALNDQDLIDAGDAIEWAPLSTAMSNLVSVDAILVNGLEVSTIKDDPGALVNKYMEDKELRVSMPTNGGVYADVADHCGNYSSNITISKVQYGTSLSMENVPAVMTTATTVTPVYLSQVGSAADAAGSPSGDGEVLPLSEFYGYIIDLAFRTNAASSNLLLQQTPADRIYGDNAAGSETWGGGSSMTFASGSSDFTNDQVKELMKSINIVFFTPAQTGNSQILAFAKLDVSKATVGADGVTAPLYIEETVKAFEVIYQYQVKPTGATENVTRLAKVDAFQKVTTTTVPGAEGAEDTTITTYSYYFDEDLKQEITATTLNAKMATAVLDKEKVNGQDVEVTFVADSCKFANAITGEGETAQVQYGTTLNTTQANFYKETYVTMARNGEDAVITALTQNTIHHVSVLVYLDGETVTNADVSATGSSSMTGKLNLQFASSATLVPMEYKDLHNATSTNTNTGTN